MADRAYQQEAVGQLRQAIKRSGSAVYVLPTGGGKTVVAAEVARLGAVKGSRTLFLVHRRELVRQAIQTLTLACPGMNIGVEAAGWPSMPWASLQVAGVQSLVRRDIDLRPDIVVVDEAHHARASTWEKVLRRWPKAKVVGLTATPERLDGKGLGEHFAEMVMGPSLPELVAGGWLAPSRTLTIQADTFTDSGKNGKQETGAVVADAVQAYLKYARGKSTIFFGINREHSRQVCAGLRAEGIRAEHVDGDDSPARRDYVMSSLKAGSVTVVGNVDLISEGFDAPGCDCVMLGCKTGSVTRYLQQAGRAMRPGEGKTALVLDLAGITYELGLPDEVREWSLEDGEIGITKSGKARPRVCGRCATAFYGGRCPTCNEAVEQAELDTVEVEMVQAKGRDERQPKVKGGRRAELMRDLAMAHRADDWRAAIREVARRRGYKPGWAEHVIAARAR